MGATSAPLSQKEQQEMAQLALIEYPKQVWYLLLSALAFATLLNIVTILRTRHHLSRHRHAPTPNPARLQLQSTRDTEATRTYTDTPPVRKGAIARTANAVFAALRIMLFRWEVPLWSGFSVNLLEMFIIASYIGALLTWEFIYTENLSMKIWANRAGHLAAIQIPLLPALSAKNNIIGWLTGVGHEKINVLHRMFSRAIFLLVLLHFVARYELGLHFIAEFEWQRSGAAAGALYLLAIVLSLRPVRMAAYELFYFMHVAIIICFLVTAYLHCAHPGYGVYIWPAFAVWGFDRFLRTARYLTNTFIHRPRLEPPVPEKATISTPLPLSAPLSPAVTITEHTPPPQRCVYTGGRHTARVARLSDTSLRITLPPTRMRWTPGQHAFLRFPTACDFPSLSGSHPFTIANLPADADEDADGLSAPEFVVRVRGGMTRRLFEMADRAEVQPFVTAAETGGGELDIEKGQFGKTSNLDFDPAQKSVLIPVFVDGPYGAPPPLASYPSAVLVAGGTGISFTLSVLLGLIHSVSAGEAMTKRVSVLWASRESSEIEHVRATLQSAIDRAPSSLLRALALDVRIYNTTWPTPAPTPSTIFSGSPSPASVDFALAPKEESPIRIIHGHPNVRAYLEDELSSGSESVFVTVCGPHGLASAVRKTLSSSAGPRSVMSGGPSVTLHVEEFSL